MGQHQINIACVVDVIGALSINSLEAGNLCLIDDGPFQSTGQGTPGLCTVVRPGQVINWYPLAVDLQTPVEIKKISFLGPGDHAAPVDGHTTESEKLDLDVWTGIVPDYLQPGVPYKYRIEFQMYEGGNSVLYVDSPALMRL
ncbi:hypothetical protein [Streptomyces sp. NPDC050504]|uniref:hypothetical protein n=1 Tax=Streptomyces sp. NPDC050504 TaxID=3365618 RepID=UPI0037AADEFC